MKTGRRTFLKSVAGASAVAGAAGAKARDRDKSTAGGGSTAPGTSTSSTPASKNFAYPRTFTGDDLRTVALPLGGIATGTISLGGRGNLQDWEIFNRPDRGFYPDYGFASIWAQPAGEKPSAYVLESRFLPPFEGPLGLGSRNAPGLPRFESARFTGEYPTARVEFEDSAFPVEPTLEAFTPIIPLDIDASSLPAAVLRYRVRNPRSTPVAVSVAFSLSNPIGVEGRICTHLSAPGISTLQFTNTVLPASHWASGSVAVSALDPESAGEVAFVRGWRNEGAWLAAPLLFWDAFSSNGLPGVEPSGGGAVGSIAMKREIAPGQSADFTFLITWRFPNRSPRSCGYGAAAGSEDLLVGNHYCSRFENAFAAAQFTAAHLTEYEARTRRFLTALRRTTMPGAVRDGALANLSTLATQTCFITSDGRFHAFEGSMEHEGSCFGNCTHVWNYETATAHLFPTISRSLRETSFIYETAKNGRMAFRELLPTGKELTPEAAADGQMGQILHLYLDWRQSGDTTWLRALWPSAKRALAYAWIPNGWDADRDGVMEGAQLNTYDVPFFGPNPLCGVWYLGALRAAEEMARALGDEDADSYRQLFDRGSRWMDAHLFNGEFYIQKVAASRDSEHPDFQMGEGCLVDQLAGQYLASLCDLGPLLDPDHIRAALRSIYRYNYKRELGRHPSVLRTFGLNDEAGLVICDYANAVRPTIPFPYFSEVMTGFEYTAAVLMMQNGMTDEGVECVTNIRKRYDGARRNPWNETECGFHYARAMASWSAIPALAGWSYHAAAERLAVKPRIHPESFESFWSTGNGWGSFAQTLGAKPAFSLRVEEGSLGCRDLELAWAASAKSATLDGRPVDFQIDAGRIRFASPVQLGPGATLAIAG